MSPGLASHRACLLRASDQTLLVSFGNQISREANRQVHRLAAALSDEPIDGVLNLHPAYCSLLIKFDSRRTTHEAVEDALSLRLHRKQASAVAGRTVEIPVCYERECGPDLVSLARMRGLTVEELIRIHSQTTYTVYFLGFAPGFAYLGTVPDAIAAPRLASPRHRVEPGSVGIAGRQTGIYPCPVPGGWQLVGRTPLALFRADRNPMALLACGDEVRFRPISRDEYERIEKGEL
ncbi:MAG TPA: 5-oxoprolinase subunit PxpB [Burkholderiaceae bacterium]|nr:5-oxoprolinase subunit PxpB [Burkholderiaceae bacterium]